MVGIRPTSNGASSENSETHKAALPEDGKRDFSDKAQESACAGCVVNNAAFRSHVCSTLASPCMALHRFSTVRSAFHLKDDRI